MRSRDLITVSNALGVPLAWFTGGGLAGFALLVAAAFVGGTPLAVLSGIVGVGIVALGARAMIRPAIPVELEQCGLPGINNSRRVGAFYVAAGLLWIAMSALAPSAAGN